MARYWRKNGVKIDVDKVGIENLSNVCDAISPDETIVTVTEDELEQEKTCSFMAGIGVGVLGTGLLLLSAAKITRKNLEAQTKVNAALYNKHTKDLQENKEEN